MQPSDVFRGCAFAFIVGLVPPLVFIVIPAAVEGVTTVLALTAFITLIGAMFALPFVGAAFIVYAVLKARGTRISWWMVPLITTSAALIALLYLIIQAPDPLAVVGYAVFMGLGTGIAFWMGAVGWHWSAIAAPSPAENHTYRERSLK